MLTLARGLWLFFPLMCPPGLLPSGQPAPRDAASSGFPYRDSLPTFLQNTKRSLRALSNTPKPIAQDVGDVAVIVDTDGSILTPTGNGTFFIDDFAALRAFYRTHGDDYDSVIFFMQDSMDFSQGFAHGGPIDNKVRGTGDLLGLGEKIVDFGPFAGSRGRLQGEAVMNCICFTGDDPFTEFFIGYTMMDVLGQEWGHRRLSSPLVIDPDGELSNGMLGRNLAHWSFFSHSGGSPVEGSNLIETSDNTFKSSPTERPFSDLDLYILGYLPAAAVQPFFFVDQINGDTGSHDVASPPEIGPSFLGRRRDITIEDIIGANGPRIPAPDASPQPVQERHAFVFLVSQGQTPDVTAISQVDNFRQAWESHFSFVTRGLAVTDTSLVPVDPAALPPTGVFFFSGFASQGQTVTDTINVLHVENLSEIEVLGGGVSVSLLATGVETAEVSITVDANASVGPRDVIFRDALGNEHLAPDLYVVAPANGQPAPYVSFSSVGFGNFSNMLPVGTSQPITIGAAFLQPGATLSISGGDVEVSGVFSDPINQSLTATLTVGEDVATGFRDITVRNPDGGQDVLVGALAIVRPPDTTPFNPGFIDSLGCGCSVVSARTPWLESLFLGLGVLLLLRRRSRGDQNTIIS